MIRLPLMLLALLVAVPAQAATVKSILKKSRSIRIELDEGETAEKGMRVCVYDEDGGEVACGKVSRVSGSKIYVRFLKKDQKKFQKIKAGMAATPVADDASSTAGKSSYKGSKVPWRIWVSWNPALSHPANARKLAYVVPKTETPSTLWSQESPLKDESGPFASSAAVSVGVGIPIGPFSLNTGIRYRNFTSGIIESDYTNTSRNPYLETTTGFSAFGLWADFQYFRMPFTKTLALDLTAGLDVDMSTATFTALRTDETGQTEDVEIAKAESKLTLLSVRTGASLEFMLTKLIGAHFGIGIMVPVVEASRSFSGTSDDPQAGAMEDPGDDLQQALGHEKASLAIDLTLGATLAF